MLILQDILSQEIVQRLGWTLLHFIWQAAAVALILTILLRVLRKSTANLRYIIACLALALIVLLPVITIKLVPVSQPLTAAHFAPATEPTVPPIAEMPAPETIVIAKPYQPESVTVVPAITLKQRAVNTLEPALPYIVSGWLIGVFGLSIWHLGGWTQLQRLKRRMVKQVDSTLLNKLKVLTQKLKVKQTVQLMESALVQIPTVVGWLRPVILLPASALTGLTSEQLEAIIAHELAHIKRLDYLINILQTVVEILGFYHPAVWWVSHKIRAERENCCDDIAVSISGDRISYAGALASMEEIRAAGGKLAIAATGGNLFRRICRLLSKDSTDNTPLSWIPAVTVILLIIALAIPTTLALTTNRADDQNDTNLETICLDGFRENRAKFKCGVLAWTRTTKNDGFTEGANWEHGGSFQLWWDGKKIATKYADDRVHRQTRREGYWIEKHTGGNAYNGSRLSRKPKFALYENWLQQIIGWQGRGSLDNQILMLKKLKNVTVNWSIVDVDDNKMFKLLTKNMDESKSDYGAYGIEYYDPSKGYGLVNKECYNSDGSPRFKNTIKLEQVIPDGWFPVEVDLKSFNPKQGKVTLHNHFKLDMKHCRFNDPSAIPKRIFEFSTAKEEEQLNKIIKKFSDSTPADPPDTLENNERLVRESVENFIAAALAGENEKAATFASPRSSVVKQLDDMREALQGQQVRIVGICVGDWNASAISSVIQGDHGRIGPLLFHTKKVILDQKVHWLIDDIDLETLDTVERKIADFLSKNPEARTLIITDRKPAVKSDLSASKETNVPVEDDISIETALDIESLTENIPPVPVLATSPAPQDEDKAHVKTNLIVVEVPLNSNIDTETLKEAKNILGSKINLRNTKVNVILRQAAKATAAAKNESDRNKRVTEKQFNALVKMLDSKGYIKILMNPMIETLNGKTAEIRSASSLEKFSLEITPSVLADGNIILEVEANIRSQDIPVFEESAPVSLRQLSSKVCVSPGESLIIGGLTENPPAPGDIANNIEKQANELLFILTPTIMTPPADSKETADTQIEDERILSADKLKKLGLAVAMYANDNNNDLPVSIRKLKLYIRDKQDFDWLRENVGYFSKGKSTQRNAARIPIAYDKTQIEQQSGTNVLFLDGRVEFLTPQRLNDLNLKRAEFLIETWLLAVNKDFIENINHNADSPDEAKDLLKLKSKLLVAKTQYPTLNDKNISLLLKAVRAHKDSKILAAPQVLCREDKRADIAVMSREYYHLKGYTEPNNPPEKFQEGLDKVEEGIKLSLKPKLVLNNNIEMDFKMETSQFLEVEERELKGSGPKVQRRTETLYYRVQNGETFLFGGHKITEPDPQDGQTEQKDLLVLIKAHTIDSSEQDKPAQAKRPAVTEPTSSTTKVITPPVIAKSRTERRNDNEQEKTKPATELTRPDESAEPNEPMVTVNLKNADMITIIEKLSEWTGKTIIPTADSMNQKLTAHSPTKIQRSKAVDMIYSALRLIGYTTEQADDAIFLKPIAYVKGGDVPTIAEDYPLAMVENKDQVVQKFFKLENYSPSQMGQIILPLVGEYGHISADESTGTLLVIDTVKSLMRIEFIIAQFDVPKADKTVTEIFEIRNGDPVEIVEILKKLINGRSDTASVIKPDTASIIESSNGPILLIPEPKRNWIIAKASPENINQIGQWIKKLDTNKSTMGLDPIDKSVYEQLEMIVDLSELAPQMSFGEVVEILENSVVPPLQIQPFWKDLLDNVEVEETTPAGMDPLPHIKLRKALEILLTSVSSTGLPKLTYIVDEGVILIGTADVLPPKKVHRTYDTSEPVEIDAAKASIKQIIQSIDKHATRNNIGIDPIDKAVYEQLETIVDLSDLAPQMSFGEVVEKLENSVAPPLQIQPIWKDLLDNAEVEQVTPASMDPLTGIKLSKALEILIASATSSQPGEFGEITYIVDDGVILIGSKDLLPHKMMHCVYNISDLVEDAADANNLIHTITETIEPESWYKLSDTGEGTIIAYPLRKPRNFAVMQTYKILQQITRFLNDTRSSRNELRKTTEHQQQPSQVQPKIDKFPNESEISMTPLEQIQKQLDELIKQRQAPKVTEPNLPPAPKVPLISNTFIDCPLIDALKYIAGAAKVTIIPDETVKGFVSCKLKDVTVEKALDIVLAGTPYVWKKTPDCYMIVSRVELLDITTRAESAKKLSNLGKSLLIYANDHDDKYPDSLFRTTEFHEWQDYRWIMRNVEYLASGKTLADPPDIPLAYDKMLLAQGKGTNVLYNDCHVGFVKTEGLKKLGIGDARILLNTKLLSVSEDYLKDVGLDANTANFSDGWTRHLAAKYPAGPNGQPYGLIIDDLHVSFLLKAVQAHNDSKVLAAPQVLCLEGRMAEIAIMTDEHYFKDYNETNNPSGEPKSKLDKVEIGTHMWLKPILTPDNKKVNLNLKLKITRLVGIIEGKDKGKYPYEKPLVEVFSTKMPCTIPDGKTMLIGGLKTNEHITKKPGTPGLKDLPLIGTAFRSKDKIKDNKMLLILVKPITNPQQKASKIRPGQKDSEEHIKRLAEQLDKKINPPGKPK